MDTLSRENVIPQLLTKVSPELRRGVFGVQARYKGVQSSKGGGEEGTHGSRARYAIKEIGEIYTNTHPWLRVRVRVRVGVRVRVTWVRLQSSIHSMH
jgi:hypothetical protein